MGLKCCKSQDNFKNEELHTSLASNSHTLTISAPIDLFDIMSKRDIDKGFKDVAEEIIKAEAKDSGSHIIDTHLALFKSKLDMWVKLYPQAETTNKLHKYHVQANLPFTPEMIYFFNLNAPSNVLKSVDTSIESTERVNYVIGEEMILFVERYKNRQTEQMPSNEQFVVKVVKRLPNKDIIEFSTSVRFTKLKGETEFNNIIKKLTNEALVYLAGTQIQREEYGSLLCTYSCVDLLSSAELPMVESCIKNRAESYYANLITRIQEFSLNNKLPENYIWFTDDETEINRIFVENRNMLTLNTNKFQMAMIRDQPGYSDVYAASLSTLKVDLLSKLSSQKTEAKDLLYATMDNADKDLEAQAAQIKSSDNASFFNVHRQKTQNAAKSIDEKIDDIIENAKKDSHTIKLKFNNTVDQYSKDDNVEKIFNNEIIQHHNKYADELQKTADMIQHEVNAVEQDGSSMINSNKADEDFKINLISNPITIKIPNFDKKEEDPIIKITPVVNETNYELDSTKNKIKAEEHVDAQEKHGLQDDNTIQYRDEIAAFENKFDTHLNELLLQNEHDRKNINDKLLVANSDNNTQPVNSELADILGDQKNVNDDIADHINSTKINLTQIRDRLNKDIISSDKYLADIQE